jgi:hypothetical protein
MLIPFIYNLFKRHPGCMVMIQRMAPEDDDIYKGEFGHLYSRQMTDK